MTRCSEEGTSQGLGWIDAETVRFRFSGESGFRIPHMGWNEIHPAKESLLSPALMRLRVSIRSFVPCDVSGKGRCPHDRGLWV